MLCLVHIICYRFRTWQKRERGGICIHLSCTLVQRTRLEMRQYFPPSLQYTIVSTDEAVFPTIFTVHQTVYRWGSISDYLYSAPDCIQIRWYFWPSLQCTRLYTDEAVFWPSLLCTRLYTAEAVFSTIFTVPQTVYRWGGISDYLYSAPDCIQMRQYFRLSLQCTRLYIDKVVFLTIFTVHQTVYSIQW